jgi:hypothetical protein
MTTSKLSSSSWAKLLGLWLADVQAHLVHDHGHERIDAVVGRVRLQAARIDERPGAVEVLEQRLGHRRAHAVVVAGEQHGVRKLSRHAS